MNKIKRLSLYGSKDQLKTYKALANEQRLEILRVLSEKPLSIHQLSKIIHSPVTTVTANVNVLEEAGLIQTRLQSGTRGIIRLCSIVYEKLEIDMLRDSNVVGYYTETTEIPIGNYFDYKIKPTCGILDDKGFIGEDDNPSIFSSEKRFKAQLIWFYEGYLEYRFEIDTSRAIDRIDIMMELCSEAPGYRENWPSDINLLLNDKKFLTYTSPGDFGGRRGRVTPIFWPINSTQYGLLKTFSITNNGSFIDEKQMTSVSLKDIKLSNNMKFRLEIEPFAKNKGGVNIFGKLFGDYSQDIVIKVYYSTKK